MTNKQVDYSKIDEISTNGLRLTKIMMRLEFALKDAGYCAPGNCGAAEVEWDRYAKEKLGVAFWTRIKGCSQIKVLIDSPPKKQVIDAAKTLKWAGVGAVMSIQELVGAVRRVRNNLFHGGKSGDPDSDRNAELFEATLFVIDQILQEDSELQVIFSGNY